MIYSAHNGSIMLGNGPVLGEMKGSTNDQKFPRFLNVANKGQESLNHDIIICVTFDFI